LDQELKLVHPKLGGRARRDSRFGPRRQIAYNRPIQGRRRFPWPRRVYHGASILLAPHAGTECQAAGVSPIRQ
jgi:hypothetical protein